MASRKRAVSKLEYLRAGIPIYIGPKVNSGYTLERLYDRMIEALAKPREERSWWDRVYIRSILPLFSNPPEGRNVRLCGGCRRAVSRAGHTKAEWAQPEVYCVDCRHPLRERVEV